MDASPVRTRERDTSGKALVSESPGVDGDQKWAPRVGMLIFSFYKVRVKRG